MISFPCSLADFSYAAFPLVVRQQATKPGSVSDRLGVHALFLRRIISHAGWPVAEPLMWPDGIVIAGVSLHDVIQQPQIKAKEVIQTLPLQAADPRLGIAVDDGGLAGLRGIERPMRKPHRSPRGLTHALRALDPRVIG